MMKHNAGNRRTRNRGGGKRQGGGGRNNYESNGPEVKVRGTAQQVLEKYLALARDAASAGDRIKSESYFQFAEHYYRIANADGTAGNSQPRRDGAQSGNGGSRVDGMGPQPAVDDADTDDDDDDDGDNEAEVVSTAPRPAREASDDDSDGDSDSDEAVGKIDESVLPAAVPTAPAPRRRRRTKAAKEDDAAPEPEVA
jgi:hypothetical protein